MGRPTQRHGAALWELTSMALAGELRAGDRPERVRDSGRRQVALELRPQDLHTRGCFQPHGHLVPADTDDL